MSEIKEKTDIICDVCGAGPFKTAGGLAGHKKIAHNVEKKIVQKDEMVKRLETIETQLAGKVNPGTLNEEELVNTLKLLLPTAQNFNVILGPFKRSDKQPFIGATKYEWIVCKENESEVPGI